MEIDVIFILKKISQILMWCSSFIWFFRALKSEWLTGFSEWQGWPNWDLWQMCHICGKQSLTYQVLVSFVGTFTCCSTLIIDFMVSRPSAVFSQCFQSWKSWFFRSVVEKKESYYEIYINFHRRSSIDKGKHLPAKHSQNWWCKNGKN